MELSNKGNLIMSRARKSVGIVVIFAVLLSHSVPASSGDSDYDILVLTDQPVNMALRENLIESIYPLELESGAVITLITYNREQWNSALYRAMPFSQNVERDGVTL